MNKQAMQHGYWMEKRGGDEPSIANLQEDFQPAIADYGKDLLKIL